MTAGYTVTVTLAAADGSASGSWTVSRGDDPAPGPALPLSVGWRLKESGETAERVPEPLTAEFGLVVPEPLPWLGIGSTVTVTITLDQAAEPLVDYAGRVTDLDAEPAPPHGTLYNITSDDHITNLAETVVGTEVYPQQAIWADGFDGRLEDVAADAGLARDAFQPTTGLIGDPHLTERRANPQPATSIVDDALAAAVMHDPASEPGRARARPYIAPRVNPDGTLQPRDRSNGDYPYMVEAAWSHVVVSGHTTFDPVDWVPTEPDPQPGTADLVQTAEGWAPVVQVDPARGALSAARVERGVKWALRARDAVNRVHVETEEGTATAGNPPADGPVVRAVIRTPLVSEEDGYPVARMHLPESLPDTARWSSESYRWRIDHEDTTTRETLKPSRWFPRHAPPAGTSDEWALTERNRCYCRNVSVVGIPDGQHPAGATTQTGHLTGATFVIDEDGAHWVDLQLAPGALAPWPFPEHYTGGDTTARWYLTGDQLPTGLTWADWDPDVTWHDLRPLRRP